MCGKQLDLSHHVKYLGVYLVEYLNWATNVNQNYVKLVKANAMLSKIRYFVSETTLQSMSFVIFDSHFSYVCTAWGESIVSSHSVYILLINALREVSFAKFSYHTLQLFN